jgi:hypothetical protein
LDYSIRVYISVTECAAIQPKILLLWSLFEKKNLPPSCTKCSSYLSTYSKLSSPLVMRTSKSTPFDMVCFWQQGLLNCPYYLWSTESSHLYLCISPTIHCMDIHRVWHCRWHQTWYSCRCWCPISPCQTLLTGYKEPHNDGVWKGYDVLHSCNVGQW